MDKNELMKFFQDIVASGKTAEEALSEVIEKATAVQPVVKGQAIANRPEWIASLSSLSELDRAIKVAFAKRSKAKGRDSQYSYDRCTKEITAGQERARELREEIRKAPNPMAKAIELDEDPSGIVQLYLTKKEVELEVRRMAIRDGKVWTNTTIKAAVAGMTDETPESVVEVLEPLGHGILAKYNERLDRHDMRIQQVNRLIRFFESLK